MGGGLWGCGAVLAVGAVGRGGGLGLGLELGPGALAIR
jgi:hypothetical protein